MANEFVAEPDLQFTKDLIAAGGTDVKKCYQCATCSVACRVSPDNNPYPRKEMIWAQWGLKDKLLSDPDVWLCHQCNDCSTLCPRGANPADLMKAVRKMHIQQSACPSFMGKLVGESSLFVVALAIPIIVVLLIVHYSGWKFPSPVVYSAHGHVEGFINVFFVQLIFGLGLLFAVASLLWSLYKYWRMLEARGPIPGTGSRKPFIPSLIEALQEILPHTTFKDCEANNIRYAAHLLTFWGMIGLFVTTAIVAFLFDIIKLNPPSMWGPGTTPIKILGNVSAIAFVVGLTIMLVRRMTAPEQTGGSSYFDWFFLLIILGAGYTGLLTELFRLAGSVGGAYALYAVHLMFVLALLLYLPFSKFAHLGYRIVAIAWSKSVGRNVTLPVSPNYVPPASGETADSKS